MYIVAGKVRTSPVIGYSFTLSINNKRTLHASGSSSFQRQDTQECICQQGHYDGTVWKAPFSPYLSMLTLTHNY